MISHAGDTSSAVSVDLANHHCGPSRLTAASTEAWLKEAVLVVELQLASTEAT